MSLSAEREQEFRGRAELGHSLFTEDEVRLIFAALDTSRAQAEALAEATVQGVIELMSEASLPFDESRPETIYPHSNGYSCWFRGKEAVIEGVSTASLSAKEIVERIAAYRKGQAHSADGPEREADRAGA